MQEENLKQKTKKGLYWQFLNQFSNYGIQFIIGIFMARLLSPTDYGITALPAVFMSLAYIFMEGGFSDALVRKKDMNEKDISTAFYYSFCVGLLCYISLYIASPYIADFYKTPVLKDLMRVTSLSFLYGPLNTPQNIILKRRLDFKTPAKISVIVKILSGFVGVGLAYAGYGVWALVLSSLFSGVIVLCANWYIVRWYPTTGWSKESFKYLWGFGNKMIGSQLLETLYNNITPIFIGKYYSPADLGVYNRASGYAKLPSENVSRTLSQVTMPVISKIQDDDERLATTYRRMIRVTAFIVFPMMMTLAALARPLVIIMVTAKWEACIILLQIMCFSMMWWPIHSLNLSLLTAKGRSDLFLRLEVIKKSYGVLILICTLPFGLVVFCLGGVVSSLISLVVNTYYTGKIIGCGFLMQTHDILPIFILSLFSCAAAFFATIMFGNLVIQIIVGGIFAVTIYLGCSYLLKFEEINEVRYLLNRNK